MKHTLIVIFCLLSIAAHCQIENEPFKKYYDGKKYYYPEIMLPAYNTNVKNDTITNVVSPVKGVVTATVVIDSNDLTVFIINATDTTISFQLQDGAIPSIREAKDSKGVWQPIEYWYWSWCGNSYSDEIISSNTQVSFKSIEFKGDFTTQIRFKILLRDQVLYSAPYKGRINKKQFNKPASEENLNFLE